MQNSAAYHDIINLEINICERAYIKERAPVPIHFLARVSKLVTVYFESTKGVQRNIFEVPKSMRIGLNKLFKQCVVKRDVLS